MIRATSLWKYGGMEINGTSNGAYKIKKIEQPFKLATKGTIYVNGRGIGDVFVHDRPPCWEIFGLK